MVDQQYRYTKHNFRPQKNKMAAYDETETVNLYAQKYILEALTLWI